MIHFVDSKSRSMAVEPFASYTVVNNSGEGQEALAQFTQDIKRDFIDRNASVLFNLIVKDDIPAKLLTKSLLSIGADVHNYILTDLSIAEMRADIRDKSESNPMQPTIVITYQEVLAGVKTQKAKQDSHVLIWSADPFEVKQTALYHVESAHKSSMSEAGQLWDEAAVLARLESSGRSNDVPPVLTTIGWAHPYLWKHFLNPLIKHAMKNYS